MRVHTEFLDPKYIEALKQKYGADVFESDDIYEQVKQQALISYLMEEKGLRPTGWQVEVLNVFVKYSGRAGGKTFLINLLKELDDEGYWEELHRI